MIKISIFLHICIVCLQPREHIGFDLSVCGCADASVSESAFIQNTVELQWDHEK